MHKRYNILENSYLLVSNKAVQKEKTVFKDFNIRVEAKLDFGEL